MGFLSPERDFASNKDFPPSSQPTALFSLLSNLPILLSPITNARGPHSCLVCDVICFPFLAKGLGGLLFCFLEDLQQGLLFPISQRHWIQAKYMRRNLQTKVPGKHYVQPPQRRSTGTRALGTGHRSLGNAISYKNSLCSYCSKPRMKERLYSHPGVCSPVLLRVLWLDNCSHFFPVEIIRFLGLSRPVGLQ